MKLLQFSNIQDGGDITERSTGTNRVWKKQTDTELKEINNEYSNQPNLINTLINK